MKKDEGRLRDVLESIEAIRRRVGKDRAGFDADELLRVWCLHHITLIGEAVAGLSAQLRGRYTAVAWRDIISMRSAIKHGCFSVDWDEVWVAVDRDIDQLAQSVKEIITAEGWESK
jgi:uncharacterized protein with HEPN domain